MASPEKSAVPVAHGFPNPFYQRIADLISRQAEIKDLARAVQDVGLQHKTQTGYNFNAVLSELEQTDVKRRLKELWDNAKTGRQTLPVLAPPPRPNQIYGRFGRGVRVVDVGSGNCSKLRKYSGILHLSVVDPELVVGEHVFKSTFRVRFDEVPKSELRGAFISSFMSLPQLPEADIDYITTHDGLHMVPDHAALLASGVAEAKDGKIMVRTAKKTYSDRLLQLPGYSPVVGYKVCPTYEMREVKVVLASSVESGDACDIDATPCCLDEINFHDATWKVDGVPLELETNDGVVFVSRRNGDNQVGTTDFEGHMCLHLEEFEGGYSLIRVLAYKGFIPPHSGECLRLFAEKLSITINGKKVVGPIVWEPGEKPPLGTDGVITRIDERDFYCKPGWTVDLMGTNIAPLRNKLSSEGLIAKFDRVRPALSEYLMTRSGCEVSFSFVKERPDKDRPTTLDSVVFMLSRKTLKELESLTGTPWKACV